MSHTSRNEAENAVVESESPPKKRLLEKRVVRAFAVRSNLRTGACNETGTDACGATNNASYGCGRSR